MEVAAMSIIWTILIGFIVGLLAKVLTPGRDPSGFVITALIGIAGSLLATYGGQALGLYHAGEPAGFLGSLIGAIILLVIYHMVRGRTAVQTRRCPSNVKTLGSAVHKIALAGGWLIECVDYSIDQY